MVLQRDDGSVWALGGSYRTSDGFVIANGVQLDPETHEELRDEFGFPVMHDFFLGRA